MRKAKKKAARKRLSSSKSPNERNTHILVFVVVISLVLFYFSIFKSGELSLSSSKDISGKGYFGSLQCGEVVCDYKITDQANKDQLVSLSEGSTTELNTADHTLEVTLVGKGDIPDSCKTHFKWCNINNGECLEEDKNMINGQIAAYSYGMSVTLDQGFCFEPIIPPCLTDADCTEKEICEISSGKCIISSPLLEDCIQHSDCSEGKVCENNQCVNEKDVICVDTDVISSNDLLPGGIDVSLDQAQYINYHEPGKVTTESNNFSDACMNITGTMYLIEQFCDPTTKQHGTLKYLCPEDEICSRGECIPETFLQPPLKGNCQDTDIISQNDPLSSGIVPSLSQTTYVNYGVKGTVYYNEQNYTDACSGIYLTEYFCDVKTNLPGKIQMVCPQATRCNPDKGACISTDALIPTPKQEPVDLCLALAIKCPAGSSCFAGNCYQTDNKGNIGENTCAEKCPFNTVCFRGICSGITSLPQDIGKLLEKNKVDLCKNINCLANQACLKGICLNKNPDGSLGDGTCSNACPKDNICLNKECLLADDVVINPAQTPKEDALPSEGDTCIDSKSCAAGLSCQQNICAKITCSSKQDPLCPENSECNSNSKQCEPTNCNAEKVCKGYYYCAENICQPMYGVTISPKEPFDSEALTASSSAYGGKGIVEDAVTVYNWYKNNNSITIFNIPVDASQVKETKNSIKDISGNNLFVEQYGGELYSDASLPTDKYSLSISGNNEYLKIPFSSELNVDAFTLELMINPQKLTGKRYIIGVENAFSLIHDSEKGLLFTIHGVKGGTANVSLAPLKEKQWYHVALQYTAKIQGSELSLFVDGTLVATESSKVVMQDIENDLYIGLSPEKKQAFEGYLDELRMYSFLVPEMQLKKNVKGFDTIHESLTSAGDVWKVVVYVYDDQGKLVINKNIKSYDQVEIQKNQPQQDVKKDNSDDKKGGKKTPSNLYKGNIFDKTTSSASVVSKNKPNYFSITKLEKKQKSSAKAAASKPVIQQTKAIKEEAVKPTCSDNIKNQDETNIDCGGSCEPCSEEQAKLARWWIWVVLAVSLFGILVLIGEARVYNLFSRTPKLTTSKQVPQTTIVPKEDGALAFMKEQLNQGIKKDEIIDHMLAAGWDEEFIHNLFDKHFEHMLSERDKAQLTKFVDYYKKKGMSSEEIKQTLEDGGWDKDVLDKLLGK